MWCGYFWKYTAVLSMKCGIKTTWEQLSHEVGNKTAVFIPMYLFINIHTIPRNFTINTMHLFRYETFPICTFTLVSFLTLGCNFRFRWSWPHWILLSLQIWASVLMFFEIFTQALIIKLLFFMFSVTKLGWK